jgi:signal transduction histidine kinase
VHKLLAHQLRNATRADGSIDDSALMATLERSYEEFDRERRLNDRAAKLMEEELKAANEAIKRNAELRLIDALEAVPCGAVLADANFTIQNVNSTLTALCTGGVTPPAQGESLAAFLSAIPEIEDGAALVRDLINGGYAELQIAGHWYLGAARKLTDSGYMVTFSAISILKEREAAIAMAKEAAESANRLKSQFLAVTSHELRTPLNAILGFSEVIRDCIFGNDEAAWKRYAEYAESIHNSGRHLLTLISEILDLSKIEAGSYTLEPEPIELSEVASDSLALLQPQAQRGGVALLPLSVTGDCHVEADRRAIAQVIINLLSNAVKFTPSGGEVALTITGQDAEAVIEVRDTGIGIAREHLENVFLAFHQGDAKLSRQYEGTGLGLSITRGIVEMHGGVIGLASEQGIGTTVTIKLPRRAKVGQAKNAA